MNRCFKAHRLLHHSTPGSRVIKKKKVEPLSAQGTGVRGQGSGVRGQGLGVRGQGLGVRGQGSGFEPWSRRATRAGTGAGGSAPPPAGWAFGFGVWDSELGFHVLCVPGLGLGVEGLALMG